MILYPFSYSGDSDTGLYSIEYRKKDTDTDTEDRWELVEV